MAGLARLYLEMGEVERAKQLLDSAPAGADKDAGIVSLKAAIEIAEREAKFGDLTSEIAGLQAKLLEKPEDHATRLELAIALNAQNQRDAAVDELIEIIRKNRTWNEDAARKQLLQFFEAWGFKDEASVAGRRKLSAVLFS